MTCDHPTNVCMRNIWQKAEQEEKLVLILIPGSREHLASRKCMMSARNMGMHVQHSTFEYQRNDKTGQEIGFPCSQDRRKETSK
jgi:hypothetical protein